MDLRDAVLQWARMSVKMRERAAEARLKCRPSASSGYATDSSLSRNSVAYGEEFHDR